jgi:hypothetical protein
LLVESRLEMFPMWCALQVQRRLARFALAVLISVLSAGPCFAGAGVLYGGRDDKAGAPAAGAETTDPGSSPGTGAIAAGAAKLGGVRTYGGVNLGQGVSLEAAQMRPFGDTSKASAEALSLVGKAKLPVTDGLSITGKMGLQYQQSSLFPGGAVAGDGSSPSPVYGVGLAYQTAGRVELRAESERVAGRPGDPKSLTGDSFLLGARVRF